MGQCPLLKQIKLKERKERIAVQPQPYVYAWVRQREMSVLVLKVDDTAFSHLELISWHTGVCVCACSHAFVGCALLYCQRDGKQTYFDR